MAAACLSETVRAEATRWRRAGGSPIFANALRSGIYSRNKSTAVLDETLAAVRFAERGGAVAEMIRATARLRLEWEVRPHAASQVLPRPRDEPRKTV